LQYVASENLTSDSGFYAEFGKNRRMCWQYQALQNKVRVYTFTVSQKRIPNTIDNNLNNDYRILLIFGKNIADTTGIK